MKTSLTISAILAILIALLGWSNRNKLAALGETHARLTTEARELGIDTGTADSSGGTTPHRERPARDTAAKATAAEFIAFARELEEMQKNGGEPADRDRFQQRILGFMDRMASLDSAQLKILIGEFRDAPGLSPQMQQGLISFTLGTLSNNHPHVAVELLAGAPGLLPNTGVRQHYMGSALAQWARRDPARALEWMRANSGDHPELVNTQAKAAFLGGISIQDPKLAFSLIGELDAAGSVGHPMNAISMIMRSAGTPAQRDAVISALEDHLSTIGDAEQKKKLRDEAFGNLGIQLAKEGFSSATAWLAGANLAPEEMDAALRNFDHSVKSNERGQWIQWMSDTLPQDQAANHVRNLFGQWTRDDYQAAGKWLVAAPDGAIKHAAINTYVIAVAPYDPATAEQWALTLPAGFARAGNLKAIHANWSPNDPDGAAAFARKHGIKE